MSNRHGMNTPLTPQTDPNNFPPLRFGEDAIQYPKMLLKEATQEDIDENLRNRITDPTTGATTDPHWRPVRLGQRIPVRTTQQHIDMGIGRVAGEPLIVRNPEEEFRVTGEKPALYGYDFSGPRPHSTSPARTDQDTRIDALESGLSEVKGMMGEVLSLLRQPQAAAPAPVEASPAKEEAGPMLKRPPGRPPGRRPQVAGTVIEGD